MIAFTQLISRQLQLYWYRRKSFEWRYDENDLRNISAQNAALLL